MSDSISREQTYKILCEEYPLLQKGYLRRVIDKVPSAERTGHWIQISPAKIYECSECGQNVMTDDLEAYDYCHGCGARMVSEDDT